MSRRVRDRRRLYARKTMSEAGTAQVATQQANNFSLSGHGIHVDYSSTSINGQPRLAYHDHLRNLSFAGAQIRTAEVPDIGSIVSVTLTITPDVGSTTVSVLCSYQMCLSLRRTDLRQSPPRGSRRYTGCLSQYQCRDNAKCTALCN
jgi:hypothetical protein